MTKFDDQLAERVQNLDAAIPTPTTMPVRPRAGRATLKTSGRGLWRGGSRLRRLSVGIAIAALLIAATAATANRLLYPDLPEPRLEGAIEGVFADRVCRPLGVAQPEVRAAMDTAGYADWTIEPREGADDARCVGASVIPPLHVVMLMPIAGWEVTDAMDWLMEELRTNCLNRAEAMQLASSVMHGLGISDFSIRADPWGPKAVPLDTPGGPEAYIELAEACFVYSGVQQEHGHSVIYLWGPWP